MLGAALAYGRDRQDDAIRDEARMRLALSGRPILGSIPESADEGRGRVGTLLAPWSPLSEAYRTLNSNIRFLTAGESDGALAKIVLVSSAQPGEGKTSVSTNLAVTAARAGMSVILVDADLRNPGLASRFGLDLPVGLSDLLVEDLAVKPHLYPVGDGNLRVLSGGTVPPNPAELLASSRSGWVLEELARQCQLVIVDSAPVMRVADSLELVRHADLIVLVAKQGTSRLRDYTAAIGRVRQVGGQVAGGVLNHVGGKDGKELTYGYGAAPETATSPPSAAAAPPSSSSSKVSILRRLASFTRLGRNPAA
jgi:capsular exopolysaccharide synthesis family protein